YHAGNVILHGANAVLACLLFERIGLGRRWAFVGALVFALHPLCAEPVSWVSGRKDLVAATLGLSPLVLWEDRRAVPATVASLGAALSQPSVFALPLWSWLRRRQLRVIAPALLGAGALTVVALVGHTIAIKPEVNAGFPLRMFRTVGFSLSL